MTTTKPQPIHATITPSGVMVEFEDGKSQLFPFRELSAAALAAADEMLVQSGAAGWLPRVDRAEEDALWASFIPEDEDVQEDAQMESFIPA